MDCARVASGNIVERYLVGDLEESEREDFERHFFECDDCLREVEALRDLQQQLSDDRREVPAVTMRPRPTQRWVWASGLAAGLAMALVAALWWTSRPGPPVDQPIDIEPAATAVPPVIEPQPETIPEPEPAPTEIPPEPGPDLAELARIEPPYYEPIRLRGATHEAQRRFRTAMESYLESDYVSAIPGLEEAAKLDPQAPNISFFLGACYLLTDRTSEGTETLQHTVDLGDTPFLEESLLLLAKANIGEGKLDAARSELQSVVALDGSFESEAKALLDSISIENPGSS